MDNQGRTTEMTDPNGNVTYTVYDDPDHEVRAYPGWNSTTGTTGPIQVSIDNRVGGYTDGGYDRADRSHPRSQDQSGPLSSESSPHYRHKSFTVQRFVFFQLLNLKLETPFWSHPTSGPQ